MNQEIREDYSSAFLKWFYPFWRKVNLPGQHRGMIRDAVAALDLKSSSNVLEIACGSGDTTESLTQKIGPMGRILSTDVSMVMLKLAEARAQAFPEAAVAFRQLDASKMEFAQEFNALVCVLGFSVIPDYREAILRAHKALVPGGRIAVLDAQFYKRFPLTLINPFVKIFHRLFRAQERDLRTALNERFIEISYHEYLGGSYFLYVGRRE